MANKDTKPTAEQSIVSALMGRAIKLRRTTLKGLADELGVAYSTAARWFRPDEGGLKSYKLSALIQLFRFAGESMDDVFGVGTKSEFAEMRKANVKLTKENERLEKSIDALLEANEALKAKAVENF